MPEPVHFSRGPREFPTPQIQIRGSAEGPYRSGRPLRLPGDGGPRRSLQFNYGAILRILLPIGVLAGLGVGVFFGVDVLLEDDEPEAAAATEIAAEDGAQASGDAAAQAGDAETAGEQPSDEADSQAAAVADAGDDATAAEEQAAAQAEEPPAEDAAVEQAAAEEPASGVLTPADVGGAPIIVERGAATPIPPAASPALANGASYDPDDATVALSNIWPAGTVLDLTRLPGGPLLTEEEAAQLIGSTIRVTVGAAGDFLTELQLSPAAFAGLAKAVEPIVALRIEVVEAPPR